VPAPWLALSVLLTVTTMRRTSYVVMICFTVTSVPLPLVVAQSLVCRPSWSR